MGVYGPLWPSTKVYIVALYSYECLPECIYQGLIYTAMMSTFVYKVYIAFSLFPDVYDPAIKLNMQSANGTRDWSLGLARNVPFTIGTITLYLQVHIIDSPAYDILLGRPF